MCSKEYVIVATDKKDLLFGGDVHLFWGQNGCGYTAILQRAGIYEEDEALEIFSHSPADIPIEVSKFVQHNKILGTIKKDQYVDFPVLLSKGKKAHDLIQSSRLKMNKLKLERAVII